MVKMLSRIAAVVIVIASCSGAGTEEGASSSGTTVTVPPAETTAPTVASTTTISATTSAAAVTTTQAAPTTSTSSTTTTEAPGEVNPPDVEAWWCRAFEASEGQSPADFAQRLADDFRHGYTDVPADTLDEAADQAALALCDPEYGRAVADALSG